LTSKGQVLLVRKKADLHALEVLREQGHPVIGAMLGVEGAHCLEGSVENLAFLDAAGFRMIGLAHFFDNEMAGSAHGEEKGGLSPEGEKLLDQIEARGMLVDLAHASAATIDQVLQRSTRPVLVSHTGLQGICDSPRNLTDAQVRGVAATGGVIGVGFWSTAVCGSDVAAIARSVRYGVDLVGVDHICLGSDFDGAVRTPFDASGLALVTQALLEQGFQDFEIAKIMGGNLFRVLAENLP
jgi:microsomal dipeptidase-like Zn-dependent dipeptidase